MATHWFLARIHELAEAEYGKTFADLLLYQQKGESTNGTSKVFMLTNNPGGFTQGQKPNRSGARQPEEEGANFYKEYDTPEQAYDDLKRSFFNYYPEIYNAKSIDEYASILKANGYFTKDLPSYIQMMINNSGEMGEILRDHNYTYQGSGGTADEKEWADPMSGSYGGLNPFFVGQNLPISPYGLGGSLNKTGEWVSVARGNRTDLGGSWSAFKDSFADAWLNNGTISLGRNALITKGYDLMGMPREDLTTLNEATLKQTLANLGMTEDEYNSKQGRRYETFEQIKSQAWDTQQLLLLAKMKGEDLDREERIEARGTTAMGVAGMLTGTLLDPLNLVPALGQEALAVKLMGRAGGALGSKLLSSQFAHIAEIGLTNGLINVGDQYVANKAGFWNQQNYGLAFALGAGAGAGLSFLRRNQLVAPDKPKGKNVQTFENEVETTRQKAVNGITETEPVKPKTKIDPETIAPELREPPKVEPLGGLKRLDDDLVEPVMLNIQKKDGLVDKELINTLNERYDLKIKGDITGDTLGRYLHNEPDVSYVRSTKLVKTMEAYGLETVEDMARHVLAYNKHSKTGAIKEYFEDIIGGKLSDAQFLDVARHIKEGGTFKNLTLKLDDGSMFVNGERVSKDNIIGKAIDNDPMFDDPSVKPTEDPEVKTKDEPVDTDEVASDASDITSDTNFEDVFRLEKEGRAENNAGFIRSQDAVDREQQLGGNKIVQVAGRKAETSRLIGNRYGVFIDSVSRTMNKIAKLMGIDPRMRDVNTGNRPPVSMEKKVFMKKYEKPQSDFRVAFKDWCVENNTLPTANAKRRFNEEVNNVYDSKHNPYNADGYTSSSKAINNAVKAVEDFRELDMRLHKLAGTLPEDFQGAGELWRRIDYDKQGVLRTKFSSDKNFFNFIKDMAMESIKWNDIDPKFKEEYIELLQMSDKEAEEIMRKKGIDFVIGRNISGSSNAFKDMDAVKGYIKNQILSKDENMFREVVAGHWAEQVTKRQDDILSDVHVSSNKLGYYQARLPMDTNKVFELPDGNLFTFNDSLRNQDLDTIMAYVANRSSGTMALKRAGIDNPVTDLRQIYERVEGELSEAVQKRLIPRSQMTRELEELKDVFHNISGALIFPEHIHPDKVPDMIKRILLGESYRQNGMNFGVNQIGEMVGGTGVVGARALFHYIPALHDLLHKLKYSKDFSAKQLSVFKDMHLGHELAQHIWYNPKLQRNVYGSMAEQQGVTMKLLGNIQSAVDFGGKVTSTINQISRLTHLSVAGIKADIMPEMMLWARGEFNSTLRKNLFSDRHLAEAGIRNADEFKKILRDRLMNLGDEDDALSKAITKWQDEDLTSYMKLEAFLDLASQRAILQPDLWNTARKYNGFAGLVQGIVFQFKNFSQMALNGHLGRILNSREREDFNLLMTTSISNGVIWATSVFFNSFKYFGNDEQKRQEYLEKTLTPERLITTGMLRSSVLSGLSFANDAWEVAMGGTTSRTTVDRDPNKQGGLLYNLFTQLPATQSAYRAFNGATSTPEIMANLMANKDTDVDPLVRLFPLDRWLPVKGALSILADKADLEQKRQRERKRKQDERNKKKLEQRKEKNGQQNVQNQSLLDMLK